MIRYGNALYAWHVSARDGEKRDLPRRRRSAIVASGLALGVLLAPWPGPLDAEAFASPAGGDSDPSLFESTGPTMLGDRSKPRIVRSRTVSADLGLLSGIEPGERLRLDLFENVSVVAVFNSTHRANESSLSLNGSVEGQPGSMVSFVMNDGEMTGILRGPGLGTYKMRVSDGLGRITELDEGAMPACASAEPIPADGGDGGSGDPPGGYPAMPDPCDEGSLIDVLVLYTPQARIDAGGTAAIEAEAQLALDISNVAYANSVIQPRLRLVHTAETDYDEGGSYFDHLDRLTFVDGFMDEAHALRDEHGADLVTLLVADGEWCGLAWVMTNPSPTFASYAFSVTTWYCAAGNLSFPHELGHNMGCCHEHGNCNGGAFDYSWGHRFYGDSGSQFRTVMAYSPGMRIQNFSNPDIDYDGQPTGVASGSGAADNARTIDENASILANFRCSVNVPNCPEDTDGDGVVGFADLLGVLAMWNQCVSCPEDIDGDNAVGFSDLLAVLAAWGPCS